MFLLTHPCVVRCLKNWSCIWKLRFLGISLVIAVIKVYNSVFLQIDLREDSVIQFVAPSSYPIITFGPFSSPTAALKSFSRAVGNFLFKLKLFCTFGLL